MFCVTFVTKDIFTIFTSNLEPMEKRDLLFFCSMCKDKPAEEIEKIKCTIPHTIKEYKRGEHIAYTVDKVQHLIMLVRGTVKTELVSTSVLTPPMEESVAP